MYKNIQCIKQMVDGWKKVAVLPANNQNSIRTKLYKCSNLCPWDITAAVGFESFDTIFLM